MVNKKELGKGIRALLSGIDDNVSTPPQEEIVHELAGHELMLPLDSIEVNPDQPRKEFDPLLLEELAASIKTYGIIQPLTVRRLNAEKYQLIAGERRYRAARIAGLKAVPAFIRLANDQELLEMALVENIQREDLNSMEVAFSYQRLIDECNLTHELLSQRVGKERSTITNYLRLLKLPPEIQQGIKRKQVSMGHARALAGVEDIAVQLQAYREVVSKKLSVRETEQLLKRMSGKPQVPSTAKSSLPLEYKKIQDNLSQFFGSKVLLHVNKEGKGSITIHFASTHELNRILDSIE